MNDHRAASNPSTPTTPAAATGIWVGMAKALLLLVEPAPPAPFCNGVSVIASDETTQERHQLTLVLPDVPVALGVEDDAFTNVADTVTWNVDPSKFVAVTTAAAVAGSVLLAYSVVFPSIVTFPIVVMLRVMVNVLLTASRSELISNSILWTLD